MLKSRLPALQQWPLFCYNLVFFTFKFLELQTRYTRTVLHHDNFLFFTILYCFQKIFFWLPDFLFLLSEILITCYGKARYQSLILQQLTQHITRCSISCTSSIRLRFSEKCFEKTIIGYLPGYRLFPCVFFNFRCPFHTLKVCLLPLYQHSTLRRKSLLVNANSYQRKGFRGLTRSRPPISFPLSKAR